MSSENVSLELVSTHIPPSSSFSVRTWERSEGGGQRGNPNPSFPKVGLCCFCNYSLRRKTVVWAGVLFETWVHLQKRLVCPVPLAQIWLICLENKLMTHVQCWQGRKDDTYKNTPSPRPPPGQQEEKTVLRSAITTLSPACAWKKALPSAEGGGAGKTSLGKQSLNSEFLLF